MFHPPLPFLAVCSCSFPRDRVIDACKIHGDEWYAFRTELSVQRYGGDNNLRGRYYGLDERDPAAPLLVICTPAGDYVDIPISAVASIDVGVFGEKMAPKGEDPNVLRDIVLGMRQMECFPGILNVPYRTVREERERIQEALRAAVLRYGPPCATVFADTGAVDVLAEQFVLSFN